jgi:hypothetical protein
MAMALAEDETLIYLVSTDGVTSVLCIDRLRNRGCVETRVVHLDHTQCFFLSIFTVVPSQKYTCSLLTGSVLPLKKKSGWFDLFKS